MSNDTGEVKIIEEVSILSIDAWCDGSGWNWNQWFNVGKAPIGVCEWKPRKLLRWMREQGYLSAGSAGKVAIEDDQYNVVVVERSTRMPLFAIAYGEAY